MVNDRGFAKEVVEFFQKHKPHVKRVRLGNPNERNINERVGMRDEDPNIPNFRKPGDAS